MVVSALVVTLDSDPRHHDAALARLGADPRLELGPRHRERVAVVSETSTTEDSVALVEELEAAPGVARVDVVSIDFEVP